MNDLIEALTILLPYCDPNNPWPTICEHDKLTIAEVDPQRVSVDEKIRLSELGFEHDEECFYSLRYGSA